jgi:hypothetical protein
LATRVLKVGRGLNDDSKGFAQPLIAIYGLLLIAFVVTGTYAPSIQANLSTPWVGVWERIDISFFLFWVAVLAITLLRVQDAAAVTVHQDRLAA